jgi:hypothetical protein
VNLAETFAERHGKSGSEIGYYSLGYRDDPDRMRELFRAGSELPKTETGKIQRFVLRQR